MTPLHLDAGLEMRGGQWQALRLIRGLKRVGHKCRLLAPVSSPLAKIAASEDIPTGALKLSSIFREARHADVIHAHDARSHTLAVLVCARPLLVSRRVIFPIKRGLLSRSKYRRVDLFVAVSEAVAHQLRSAGIPSDRIRVIYDGVPLFPELWNADGPVLVPSFDDPMKATALALRAASSAGVVVRPSKNLEHDLEGASLLLYLTHSEGLGSAPLLALSAGVPVIASNIGGLPEVIESGVNGILVENREEEVARTLRDLLASPEHMRAMSLAASRTVRERFSEERMVAATLEAYKSLQS